ncbi:SseB family protein [Gordonia sp. JH63]|uniref:SseB family protein n=1 Tax=Gordonia sp. JH63 TaxID=2698900 RepID=UPI00131F9204|nr:SseB family protein [Gordonia sp. JH63]QHD86050.1 SseB family protein [Gordonia sp. JH63]
MTTYVDEVRAYLSGFGDPPRLYDALRDATLAVPLDLHGRLFTLVEAGIPWMLAFTTPERLREFAELTDRDLDEVRYLDVPGHALIDRVLDQAPEPTGLVVDPATPSTMTIPPSRELTPHCYYDDEGEVVR